MSFETLNFLCHIQNTDDVDIKIIYGTVQRQSYRTDLVSLTTYVYVIYKYLMLDLVCALAKWNTDVYP